MTMYDMYPDYETLQERGAEGLGHYAGYLALDASFEIPEREVAAHNASAELGKLVVESKGME